MNEIDVDGAGGLGRVSNAVDELISAEVVYAKSLGALNNSYGAPERTSRREVNIAGIGLLTKKRWRARAIRYSCIACRSAGM